MRRSYTNTVLSLALVFAAAACDDSSSPGSVGDGGSTGLDGGPSDGGDLDTGGGGDDDGVEQDVGSDGAAGDMAPDTPADDTLCEACDDDEDCVGEGSRCIDVAGENVCGTACETDDDCPDNYKCDEQEDGDQCVPTVDSCGDCADGDGDGYGVGAGCLGADCDDDNEDINPGAADGCDGVNNDCDDETDEDYVPSVCGEGACASISSCVDGDETECTPGEAAENDSTCDGADDDCDGETDEDYDVVDCGEGACANSSACEDGVETECAPLDIAEDNDATCDGADEDCDGEIDEDYLGEQCGVGACAAAGACVDGESMCTPNEAIANDDVTCDGIDDDCDEEVDEDYDGAGDEVACGFGVCRSEASCVDGVVGCTPGEPEAEIDDTCDGVDQDCDGRVDDECNANGLGFAVSSQDADLINVDVVYTQEAPADDENLQSRPRVIQLRVLYPAGLTLVDDGMPSIVRGPPVVAAQKQLTIFEPAPGELRIIIISADNSNRIGPGVLVTMRFSKNGEAAPYAFSWNEERTTFAPEEANDILSLEDANLE